MTDRETLNRLLERLEWAEETVHRDEAWAARVGISAIADRMEASVRDATENMRRRKIVRRPPTPEAERIRDIQWLPTVAEDGEDDE